MGLRTVFFCGDQSPYGRAHLRPVLEGFDTAAVVIATRGRWSIFRQALSGECRDEHRGWLKSARDVFRRWVRRRSSSYIDVPAIVRGKGVELLRTDDVNAPAFMEELRRLRPDLFVCAAYPQIFGRDLLAIPARGAVNFHPSLLPKFRGAHPHFWAIATGASNSGLSAHFMTTELDAGDIIAQVEFPIYDLTYSQLYGRIIEETPKLVNTVRAWLDDPHACARPQDHTQATTFRNDRQVHRRIFWNIQSAEQVRNLCRTEKAFCFLGRESIVLVDASVHPTNRNLTNAVRTEAGAIIDIERDGITIAAADGCVRVGTVVSRGQRCPAADWARRRRVSPGEKLS